MRASFRPPTVPLLSSPRTMVAPAMRAAGHSRARQTPAGCRERARRERCVRGGGGGRELPQPDTVKLPAHATAPHCWAASCVSRRPRRRRRFGLRPHHGHSLLSSMLPSSQAWQRRCESRRHRTCGLCRSSSTRMQQRAVASSAALRAAGTPSQRLRCCKLLAGCVITPRSPSQSSTAETVLLRTLRVRRQAVVGLCGVSLSLLSVQGNSDVRPPAKAALSRRSLPFSKDASDCGRGAVCGRQPSVRRRGGPCWRRVRSRCAEWMQLTQLLTAAALVDKSCAGRRGVSERAGFGKGCAARLAVSVLAQHATQLARQLAIRADGSLRAAFSFGARVAVYQLGNYCTCRHALFAE